MAALLVSRGTKSEVEALAQDILGGEQLGESDTPTTERRDASSRRKWQPERWSLDEVGTEVVARGGGGAQLHPTPSRVKSASDSLDAVAARQREHRLEERVRPKQLASANADPWLLADRALDHLDAVAHLLHPRGEVAGHLEEVAELIKQLATGPGD